MTFFLGTLAKLINTVIHNLTFLCRSIPIAQSLQVSNNLYITLIVK